jgi:hypothetical protein
MDKHFFSLSNEYIFFNQLKILSLCTSISFGASVDHTPPPSPLSSSYERLDKNILIHINPKLPTAGLSSFFLGHNCRLDQQACQA